MNVPGTDTLSSLEDLAGEQAHGAHMGICFSLVPSEKAGHTNVTQQCNDENRGGASLLSGHQSTRLETTLPTGWEDHGNGGLSDHMIRS